ncbi:hypothetical protein OJF2_21490 [Aquisphaera giovannonii]|uniref:Flagellin N-methylase n=1 Tax=Aquisphaera giovannonii TaxID=406548 RepID=A0A5B9W0Z5_9BACT|nr:hypothetical protein [Aquisphaera giovannonii]QEH33645.1 hypothetical protein OJF2_21490 [Aquisphaera giovannonii]
MSVKPDPEPPLRPDDEGEARDAAMRRDVLEVYRQLGAEIAALSPTCLLSGRCCRFREFDHILFLSGVEAAVLKALAPAQVRPVDDGSTCPWQDERGRCTARDGRPLGCRVYFCDPEYEPLAPSISERFLEKLRRVAERYEVPWEYAPLHHHLDRTLAPPG